jgi:O-methyltransferase involved in polyketide biosynthesis
LITIVGVNKAARKKSRPFLEARVISAICDDCRRSARGQMKLNMIFIFIWPRLELGRSGDAFDTAPSPWVGIVTNLEAAAQLQLGARQLAVPRAAARVLAACASAAQLCPDLPLHDCVAESAFQQLGGDMSDFDGAELRCTAFRTHVVDCLAKDFFLRSPDGVGIGVWSVLGTRGHRLGEVPWVDVDSPEIAELRRFVLPPRQAWLQLGTCLCHPTWVDAVCGHANRQLLLVLDESVLPTLGSALMQFFDDVSRRVRAGSELVVAFDAHVPLRPAHPFRRDSCLELVLRDEQGCESIARYPRLRFVDSDRYDETLATSVAGVNAVARLYQGVGAAALAHLRVI